jgi:hypothetical protein
MFSRTYVEAPSRKINELQSFPEFSEKYKTHPTIP